MNKELLTEEQHSAPHPNPHNSYGDTYGAHIGVFRVGFKRNLQTLKEYCDNKNINNI